MKTKLATGQLLFILFFTACTYEFPVAEGPTQADLGTVNADKFIAVGDGFLSGAMDGALYTEGQQNSLATIIASQISEITETAFNQPDINAENGFNFYVSDENNVYGKWIYRFENQIDEKPKMILTAGEMVQDFNGDKSTLNNLAVPMLTVNKLTELPGNLNPYMSRVYAVTDQSILQQVAEKSPNFVLCWLGMNDYLKYAMNGATVYSDLTSVETFRNNISQLIDEIIQKNDAKILLGNLISIENLPYFYFKTFDNLFLLGSDLGMARGRYVQFNLAVAEYNRTVPEELQRPFVNFYDNGASNPHAQPLVVIDNSLPDAAYPDGQPLEKYRQLNKNEIVLHSITDEMIENGYGWLTPLEEKFYLAENEIEKVVERTNSFNAVLEELAGYFPQHIALVDVNSKIALVAETGMTDAWGEPLTKDVIYFEGVPVGGSLYQNSIFSLDGLHFNQRGNAYVANIYIQTLNEKFGSRIKTVSINNYLGNVYEPAN